MAQAVYYFHGTNIATYYANVQSPILGLTENGDELFYRDGGAPIMDYIAAIYNNVATRYLPICRDMAHLMPNYTTYTYNGTVYINSLLGEQGGGRQTTGQLCFVVYSVGGTAYRDWRSLAVVFPNENAGYMAKPAGPATGGTVASAVIGTVETGYRQFVVVAITGVENGHIDFSAVDSLSHTHVARAVSGDALEVMSFYQSATVSAPAISGVEFDGWYINGERVSTAASFALPGCEAVSQAEYTLEARYDNGTPAPAAAVTVTYNAAGGTVSPASETKTPGAAIGVLPVPVRSGFSFARWVLVGSSGLVVPIQNITLEAEWLADPSPAGTPPVIDI